jgi:nicotinate-nucleotide adenylyltransferase
MSLTPEKKQWIGLLGGTFDPVHNGHLAVADHVLRTIGLDTVWFIPASLPPHKAGHIDGRAVSDFSHRLKMIQLAITGEKSFSVSDIEAKRNAPSYSIDTVRILLEQTDTPADLFFIIGADAFLEIATWKRYRELPSLVSFVIISRPTYSPDKIDAVIRRNYPGYTCDSASGLWTSSASKGTFIVSHMKPVPVSSTEIRKRVKNGEEIAGLVPPAVETYIMEKRLYHN